MKYDLVIWDFNGTIADDVMIGIDAANVVLSRRGMPLIVDVEKYREMFCFPIRAYYEKLGFDFDAEPYEKPADEWTAEFIKREPTLKTHEGCVEVLSAIKSAGIPQIIISSSELVMLERELEILGIRDYFDDVLGKSDNYASGKVEMAKEWARGKKYNAVFIGDSVHDLETAKAICADCILFSGGHDLRARLAGTGMPVVDSLRDVLNYM
ncbi:MAG: HAD family hydrolase [Clostridia bacterium]|nr:HAD family hydrolase [Clostridia bacterium]